jgi:hypothetical protein
VFRNPYKPAPICYFLRYFGYYRANVIICHFHIRNKVCPPATSEAGARRQLEQYSSIYLSYYFYFSTLVVPSGFAGRYSRVIPGRYCGALLRDVIAGCYCWALLAKLNKILVI